MRLIGLGLGSGAVALLVALACLGGVPLASASPSPASAQTGSAERGRELFSLYCSICHRLEGIPSATGDIGPDLTAFEMREVIAGVLPNTPDNLARWLANPQTVKRDATMPALGLSSAQTSDLVALLLPSAGAATDGASADGTEADLTTPE
jgi:mono/diheme cytochrome c family protein